MLRSTKSLRGKLNVITSDLGYTRMFCFWEERWEFDFKSERISHILLVFLRYSIVKKMFSIIIRLGCKTQNRNIYFHELMSLTQSTVQNVNENGINIKIDSST